MRREFEEETFTETVAPWLREKRHYVERFEDKDTSLAAPVDSAGFIGTQLVLIEFKCSLRREDIYYEGSRGSSIEKKIATALKGLYRRLDNRLGRALRSWDRSCDPLFILIAKRLNDRASTLLCEMLASRSPIWHFGFEVIVWDREPRTIDASAPQPFGMDYGTVEFPEMPSTAPRRKPSVSPNAFIAKIHEKGLGDLMDELLGIVKRSGGEPTNSKAQKSLTFCFPPFNKAVIGVWMPDSVLATGLIVNYKRERLQKLFGAPDEAYESLPGVPISPRGYLGESRLLRTIQELHAFWNAVSRPK